MKKEFENIDELFINALGESGEASTVEGWDSMKKKLFLAELKSFNFVNINKKYWYITAATLLIAAFLLFSLDQNNSDNEQPIVNTVNKISVQLPEAIINSKSKNSHVQNPIVTEVAKPEPTEKASITTILARSTVNKQINNQKNMALDMLSKQSLITRHEVFMGTLKSRPLHNNIGVSEELCFIRTNHQLQNNKDTENYTFDSPIPSESGTFYTLGINLGSVWMIENNLQQEKINQPVLYAGINLRYNTPTLFFETALDFSYFQSDFKTKYLYDTLLGKMIAPGYDIIEVINSQGDTVLERQFHTEIISIYDTLNSKDQVGITSHSTVLSIPVHLGFVLFHRGNFYTSLFTGVMTKINLVKNQSIPQYGTEYRKIIDFETSPANSLTPEFYFQGGLMLGYRILSRVDLEIKSTYSHLLGENNSALQKSKSNIQLSFGINYRF